MIGTNSRSTKYDRAPGFSLIEIMVSVTLFSVIILSVTGIFKLVIDSQRSAMASQNVQENIKYFLEVIAKEIRMAQKSKGFCAYLGIPDNSIFTVSSAGGNDILSFRNYYGDCVTYSLATDSGTKRFLISRASNSGFISPAKISIDALHFSVASGTSTQPTVTINLQAHSLTTAQSKSAMIMQTSITSRYYKD
jgi:prepilin-type N-terminal cleavage/methylation domain-containing protein